MYLKAHPSCNAICSAFGLQLHVSCDPSLNIYMKAKNRHLSLQFAELSTLQPSPKLSGATASQSTSSPFPTFARPATASWLTPQDLRSEGGQIPTTDNLGLDGQTVTVPNSALVPARGSSTRHALMQGSTAHSRGQTHPSQQYVADTTHSEGSEASDLSGLQTTGDDHGGQCQMACPGRPVLVQQHKSQGAHCDSESELDASSIGSVSLSSWSSTSSHGSIASHGHPTGAVRARPTPRNQPSAFEPHLSDSPAASPSTTGAESQAKRTKGVQFVANLPSWSSRRQQEQFSFVSTKRTRTQSTQTDGEERIESTTKRARASSDVLTDSVQLSYNHHPAGALEVSAVCIVAITPTLAVDSNEQHQAAYGYSPSGSLASTISADLMGGLVSWHEADFVQVHEAANASSARKGCDLKAAWSPTSFDHLTGMQTPTSPIQVHQGTVLFSQPFSNCQAGGTCADSAKALGGERRSSEQPVQSHPLVPQLVSNNDPQRFSANRTESPAIPPQTTMAAAPHKPQPEPIEATQLPWDNWEQSELKMN